MNRTTEEPQDQFFEELNRQLAAQGIQTKRLRADLMQAIQEGVPFCDVSLTTGSTYRNTAYPDIPDVAQFTRRTAQIASQVKEYLAALETAPPLLAEGLDPADGYRLLAEYNGCALAGRRSEYGCRFATWEWDDEHRHLVDGRYPGCHYERAKEDFATRSRLVNEDKIFSPGQMETLHNALNWYLEESPDLTYEDAREIEILLEQIERTVPGLEVQDFSQGQGPEMTMQ